MELLNVLPLTYSVVMTVFTMYIYSKMVVIEKLTKTKILIAICFSFLINFIHPLSTVVPVFMHRYLFMLTLFVFLFLASREKPILKVSAFVISYGIYQGVLLSSLFIVFGFTFPLLNAAAPRIPLASNIFSFFENLSHQGVLFELLLIPISIAFFIILFMQFKTERLKRGLLFWENKSAIKIGLLFSIIILFANEIVSYITRNSRGEVYAYIAPDLSPNLQFFLYLVAVVCTVGIFSWWRYHTTALYQDRIRNRELEEYTGSMMEQEQQIKSLRESNRFLQERIQGDNQLLSIMHDTVQGTLRGLEDKEEKAKAEKILEELKLILLERENI